MRRRELDTPYRLQNCGTQGIRFVVEGLTNPTIYHLPSPTQNSSPIGDQTGNLLAPWSFYQVIAETLYNRLKLSINRFMDPIKNPFSPGAGSPPPELVG